MTSAAKFAESDTSVQIDQLQAALFYLMTQYSFNKCSSVADAIVDHLNMLLQHPHIDLLPKQYAVLAGLLNKWQIHRFDLPADAEFQH